jgi:hypothetical protein
LISKKWNFIPQQKIRGRTFILEINALIKKSTAPTIVTLEKEAYVCAGVFWYGLFWEKRLGLNGISLYLSQ